MFILKASNGDYEEKAWHRGKVYYGEEYPNLLFAIDGAIYDFDKKSNHNRRGL